MKTLHSDSIKRIILVITHLQWSLVTQYCFRYMGKCNVNSQLHWSTWWLYFSLYVWHLSKTGRKCPKIQRTFVSRKFKNSKSQSRKVDNNQELKVIKYFKIYVWYNFYEGIKTIFMICWHLVYKALNEYYTVLLGHSQQFLKYHNVEWKKKVSMAPTQQSCIEDWLLMLLWNHWRHTLKKQSKTKKRIYLTWTCLLRQSFMESFIFTAWMKKTDCNKNLWF